MSAPPPALPPHTRRPWALRLALALLFLGFLSNLFYLYHNCPLDLSEDESHYWEWARHLDYGYYSKPPGIAWVIAAALRLGHLLHLTGDNSGAALMPVIRTPAVLFALCSGLLSLFLARRIFRDDRTALAVILLSAAVPMFAVGSLLITIDSPMYLGWAATIYCLWRTIDTPRHAARWMLLAGFACAAGMLFKPVLIAIPLCALIAAAWDRHARKAFFTRSALAALIIVLLSQVPVILWNAHHHWVTFLHIGNQGFNTADQKKSLLAPLSRLAEFVGGQAGGMGGLPFILLVCAVVYAIRTLRSDRRGLPPADTAPHPADHWPLTTGRSTPYRFLLAFSLPLWLFYFLMNLWKSTEVNWPAASYFTGMVLLAGIVTQLWPTHKNWRAWTTATVIVGFLLTAFALNMQRLYPLLAPRLQPLLGTPAYEKSLLFPGKWDPAAKKLRGFNARAQALQSLREAFAHQTGQDPLIISGRYDLSSSLAFYLPGHPFVFSIMSQVGGRESQYDLWPGLNQKSPDGQLLHAGQNALLVGNFDQAPFQSVLVPAFDRIDPPTNLPIYLHGILLRSLQVRRAYNFKGLPAPAAPPHY
ncbi:MAG TPA: glycosyltransferase family 39 protein [Phycisphaerae bacterium]|nr:glycosyltransferase family 39 protein [Phycisphaerae bacterium]